MHFSEALLDFIKFFVEMVSDFYWKFALSIYSLVFDNRDCSTNV